MLYLPNGYLNIEDIDSKATPFNIIVGGRGIGKTYGALKYYYEKGETIIYMRRTGEQTKVTSTAQFTPYKKILEDLETDFEFSKSTPKALYVRDNVVAYMIALSTFANIRGFDASDCAAIIYDEFIPEQTARPIKNEGEALLNAYETINRNRELEGKEPTKLWMLSNSNTLFSPILAELSVMKQMLKMSEKHVERVVIPERGLQIVNCSYSPISEKKSETALYRLVDTSFKEMALQNSYRQDTSRIKSMSLAPYKPVVRIGELTIYKHKSKHIYYISFHSSGNCPVYGTGEKEITRFSRTYGHIIDSFQLGYAISESIEAEYLFTQYLSK